MASQELPGAMQKADTNIVLGLCISNLAAPSLPILTSERRSRCAGGWQRWQGCSAPHFRAMERAPGRHHGPEPTSHVPITKVIKPQHHLVIWQITFPVIKCNIATRSAMHLGEGVTWTGHQWRTCWERCKAGVSTCRLSTVRPGRCQPWKSQLTTLLIKSHHTFLLLRKKFQIMPRGIEVHCLNAPQFLPPWPLTAPLTGSICPSSDPLPSCPLCLEGF